MTETAELPANISAYLTARQNSDPAGALAAFTDDATVIDEGNTYRGPGQIHHWLRRSGSEYSYTIELTGTRRIDEDHWAATHHLEGNFPGGVVDLTFTFTLRDGKIHHLLIAP